MSHFRRSTPMQNSRFTDEFPVKRQTTDSLLMKYLCRFRQKKEIPAEEYKKYVEQQLDQIREVNANYSLTKSEGRKYCKVFLTVNIEHIASDHEFYAIPMCDVEHRIVFQECLNDTYNTFREPFHEIKVKYLCAACVDGNWCRGEIVDIVTDMQPIVYLVDYGRTVQVNRDHLCLLKFPDALVRPFIIRCNLSILNGYAIDLRIKRIRKLFRELRRISNEAKSVCIYFNEPLSKKTDAYHEVLLLTDLQAQGKIHDNAYSLHETYGAFYRPEIQFDNDICAEWFMHINEMENAINLNTTKRLYVFISHIVSPIEFYVQSEPVKLFMSKMRRIIDAYASAQIDNHDANLKWLVGDNCLVRVQNWKTKANLKLWYRGKIIAIDRNATTTTMAAAAASPSQCTFKVFLRDYGRQTEVNRMDLMKISAEMAACQNAVQKCNLAIAQHWIASGKDLLNEAIERYQSFAISCIRKLQSYMDVDLWATNSSTLDFNDFQMWDNIGYAVICAAVRNSMELFIQESQHRYNTWRRIRGTEISNRIHLSSEDVSRIPMDLTPDDNDEDNDDHAYSIYSDFLPYESIAAKWLQPVRIDRNSFRGVVTHLTDRGVIYVQEESNHDLAHDISTTITSELLRIRDARHQHEWRTGDTCFAEFEPNQYHRAVIKRCYPEHATCLVEYVDFGTKIIQKLEDLRMATMFMDVPILAHRFFIPKLQSNSKNGKWFPGVLEQFKKQILQEFCTVRIEGDVNEFGPKKIIPCSIDPIYKPDDAYNWLRKEKLASCTGLDAENHEILYVG